MRQARPDGGVPGGVGLVGDELELPLLPLPPQLMVTASTAVAPVEHKNPLPLIAMSLPSRMPSRIIWGGGRVSFTSDAE
jgi:hypothetical protein